MAVICQFRYSPKQFSGHKPGEYSAWASDLARGNFMGRVWDDAADIGFLIHSDRLKKDFIFILTSEKRDADNDIQFWTFKSVDERGAPTQTPMTVTVFND